MVVLFQTYPLGGAKVFDRDLFGSPYNIYYSRKGAALTPFGRGNVAPYGYNI